MATLAEASLTEEERRVLARFVDLLAEELRPALRSVWLYGSRARAEQPGEESDIDVLVVAEGGEARWERILEILDEAAKAEGVSPVWFSAIVYDPERLAQRREIRSFFIQEVDRDKIVLYGEP